MVSESVGDETLLKALADFIIEHFKKKLNGENQEIMRILSFKYMF